MTLSKAVSKIIKVQIPFHHSHLKNKMVKVIPISTISDRVSKSVPKVRKIYVKQSKLTKTSKPTPKQSWLHRCFNEFAANTALHGYNHIVRENSTKWER